jgi:AcrR family transcriptional regulator
LRATFCKVSAVPKIWNQTIDAHRRAVREATLAATVALVAEHGLRSVTMSQIAQETGIGRATLYKYFPDIEAILLAWHERQVGRHLEHLAELRHREHDVGERLKAVLHAYALIQHEHDDSEVASALHRGRHVAAAQRHLHRFMRDVLAEAADAEAARSDVAPEELARYCLSALTAARELPSKAAVGRLVGLVLAGLSPPARASRT